ncbi:MAG: AMP-binding protein [Gammaproteobacteria bacterium]
MTRVIAAAPEIRSLSAYAREHALAHPDREAICGDGSSLSYAALLGDAEALAASLLQLGLRAGDVISFQLPNWVEAGVVNLAADLVGAVCNPIVPIYREGELLALLRAARTRCFFVPGVWGGFDYASMAECLQRSLPELGLVVQVRAQSNGASDYSSLVAAGRGLSRHAVKRDAAECARGTYNWGERSPSERKLLLFTSGTTGRAKGVLHSQVSLTAPLLRAAAAWGLEENGCMLMPSPVTHVTGYCCGLEMPLFLGTRTVLMERWNATRAVELVDSQRAQATIGATPFLKELLDAADAAGSRLPSLRIFGCGGASVPPALIRRASTRIAGRAFRVYGASEAPLVTLGCLESDGPEVGADTDGRLNGYDVRIVDPVSGETGCEEGEVLVRGPGLFLGYLDPADDLGAFTDEGFFRTGDLGRLEGSTLVITGRKKDLIIRGGEKISAREIEEVLMRDPRIREAAAVSMPHARLGETVCLFAVLASDVVLTLEDLREILHCAGLARQKAPERLVVVDELPTTPSGKVRKDLLRQRAWIHATA